jgi:voltage-gated potassium channel
MGRAKIKSNSASLRLARNDISQHHRLLAYVDVFELFFALVATIHLLYDVTSGVKPAHLSKLETLVTLVFTAGYLIRLKLSQHKLKYIFSFWGLIDLASVVPGYLGLLGYFGLTELNSLKLLRILRTVHALRLIKSDK